MANLQMMPRRLLVIGGLVLLLLAVPVSATTAAATIQAASCERSAVGTAYDQAKDGDTITIPAGTCTWTTALSVSKAVTIKGAGIDKTVLIHAVPWSDRQNTQMFSLTTKVGAQHRLTGMTLDGGSGDKDPKIRGMVGISGHGTNWRLDNVRMKITRTLGVYINGYSGSSYGVIDHSMFEMAGWGLTAITSWHSGWGGKLYGDGSWAAPSNLGSGEAIYVEDNVFKGPADRTVVAHGGYGGSRLVWRRNRMENALWANHGTESTSRWRGMRVCEIYDNTFVWTASYHTSIGIRSCTGAIFNNTVTGPANNFITMQNFRSNQAYAPFGKCDGVNGWDGNQGPQVGYPCLDQPGRGQSDLIAGSPASPVKWPNQKLEPIYVWNNTLKGAPGTVKPESAVIVEGRDFFHSPMPGYTPYVYPHPLVTDPRE